MPAQQAARPLPVPDVDTQGYWDGARQHRLVLLRCQDCATFIHYPRRMCRECWSENLEWEQVSGRGTIYSAIVVHHLVVAGFDSPYVVALVEPVEQAGLRIPCNIVECEPDEVAVGMKVEVTFTEIDGDVTLPQFRLLR